MCIRDSGSTTVPYTNTIAPTTAPTPVELQAAGNETMIASWSEVSDAEGYKITIYNADGTDTGLGYEYDATQFDSKNTDYISGLSYNAGTYLSLIHISRRILIISAFGRMIFIPGRKECRRITVCPVI